MMTYDEYFKARTALEDLLPAKRAGNHPRVPDEVHQKVSELRALILRSIADLNKEGWDNE